MSKQIITRRHFIMSTALLAAGCATGPRAVKRKTPPNEKLNIASIGAGGKGNSDCNKCGKLGENIVAICDIDFERAKANIERYPNATLYHDYREMLDKQKDIDAVTVSTSDHTHYPAALACIELGKHVYVQKPLTHTVWEARELRNAARRYRVATQMGNQGHAGDGVRDLCEWVWSGVIGDITEAHVWTDRPIWKQGIRRPDFSDPVPENVKWDLWLGTAPARPYVAIHPESGKECYHPWHWRGWWDFGCGALGDMGCHNMDPANASLKLTAPTTVECIMQEGANEETGPVRSTIKYEFPATKDRPAVTLYWYDGPGNTPARPEGIGADEVLGDGNANGSLLIGSKGVLTCGTYGGNPRLLPLALNDDFTPPAPYLPRTALPEEDDDTRCTAEWLNACRGGEPAGSNFDYAGPFAEYVLLGNVAIRTGKRLEWDSDNLCVKNVPEANRLISKEYRTGW